MLLQKETGFLILVCMTAFIFSHFALFTL